MPAGRRPGRIRSRVSRLRSLALRWRILIATVAAVLAVCLILLALAWRASSELMYFGPSQYAWNLSSYPALAKVVEPLKVRSSTGVTLVGRFFPGSEEATVVLSHGYGGDQDEVLPVANALHNAGFTVVTYNERSRGGSGGEGTWGVRETVDLRSVINTVIHHTHVNPDEIGEFGFSIGADISIMEAAGDKRVKAVVAAGSWPTLAGYMKSRLSDILLHPRSPYSPLALWLMQLRTGVNLSTVRPMDYIARISPRPIFLIQGLADTDVNPHSAIVNYDHARAPRSLWMVKGEGHEQLVSPGGAASSPRVVRFFERALLSSGRRGA
ncbi:MAG TPA: alpha/beta hydrolase [Solirubrobacteraceae bacterium]|jgi:cephalosporin-C deacetylase-like acetyl esterase|nr:alpha/beta hydrolase [Solirubrobacteraceae bacterium]